MPRDYMVSNLDCDFIIRHSLAPLWADSIMCRASPWFLLRAQKVGLEAGVAVLVGPQRQWDRCQIIDEGDSVAVFRQIHAGEKKFAGVARFDANVRQLLRYVDRKLAFGFFAARGAMNPAEFPLLRAKRTEQKPFPAVAFHSQHTHERARAAQRTNPHGHNHGSPRHQRGAKLGVRLQECPSKELCERSDLLVVLAGMLPVGFEAGNPGIRRQQRHLMGGRPQRRGSVLFDGGEKSAEVGKKNSEVEETSQLGGERVAWVHAARRRDVGAKRFLKCRDVLVEIEKLRGEGVFRGQALGAPDSRVVLGRTGLCGRHLRGGDESPTISLYQPGWKRLAKAMETSPRMTELNAPRSANTPM